MSDNHFIPKTDLSQKNFSHSALSANTLTPETLSGKADSLSSANNSAFLSVKERHKITACNRNYSKEGIYHPDRILDEYDLLYLTQGSWDIWEDDVCYPLKENHVLLLEPGKHHYSLTKCTPEMKNLYLHFSPLPGDGTPQNDNLCINKLTDCSSHHAVLHLFEEIIETYWSDVSESKALRLGAQLDMLFAELSDIRNEQQKTADILITEIIHRFYCSPERFFSPEELAKDYGLSLRSMSSRFKKATGMSIHQYQLKLKLDMAYDLLPHCPGRGLKDIALSFGFYDEFQFSKLFKRQFGISPSKRRN